MMHGFSGCVLISRTHENERYNLILWHTSTMQVIVATFNYRTQKQNSPSDELLTEGQPVFSGQRPPLHQYHQYHQ
jgi:hypothetical protein